MVNEGYRTIGVLAGRVKDKKESSIKDLEYIGLVGFVDPIREDAKESILKCVKSHIKVIMITGDHPTTAYLIGKELNICENKSEVVTSIDLEAARRRGQKEFDKFISSHRVFARVTPLDKLDIVESLKRGDEFVAVTGDGVNDASALKSANIGVAMGNGTDAAKETADMILLNNNILGILLKNEIIKGESIMTGKNVIKLDKDTFKIDTLILTNIKSKSVTLMEEDKKIAKVNFEGFMNLVKAGFEQLKAAGKA